MLNGIDVSHWQDGINLSRIDCDFVICKATEGINFIDACFYKHMRDAESSGKCIGFYHFARPEYNSAESEADFFYRHTKNYFGRAIPVLDWESIGKSNVTWAKYWLDRVYALTGVRPMIYMSEAVVNAYDWSSVANANYGLWCAKYRDYGVDINFDMASAGKKPNIKWWKFVAMWQWTSVGRLDGYGGNLDCNVFFGSKEAWAKYAGATKTYIVQGGDTISSIAAKCGISVDALAAKNGFINEGQVLRI